MEFGRLENVDGIKFSLPNDHPANKDVLSGKKQKSPKVYVGCPVWGESKLVGLLYPKGTKSKDFLKIYAEQFNSIELNATGYGSPALATVNEWLATTGENFAFCPKVPQQIAKTNPLGKNEEAVQEFNTAMHALSKRLGVVFLQLAPTFKPERLDDLKSFIDTWDKKLPLTIELRHPGWFDGTPAADELFSHMQKKKVGSIITDVSDRRDALHMRLTTPSAFIRFDGHDLHKSDFTRLDQWAERIASWIDQGLESVYFFVHTTQKHLNPFLANYFIEQLNTRAGLKLQVATLHKPMPV